MTTHVSSHHPARSDVHEIPTAPAPRSRIWAQAGIAAAVAGIATTVTSSMVNVVYDEDLVGDTPTVAAKLADQTTPMFVFHTVATVCAVLSVVFAAGLLRRLRSTLGDGSLAPTVAFAGLVGTAVVLILGSGLDTEFMIAFVDDPSVLDPANAAFYNHWIGTIPWVWTLAGLSGLAVYVASRAAAAPRWLGRVGLVLGGLTLLLGISPLEYMAGMTGPVWLLVTALGFAFGDRSTR
jgi:hypothetical protein